MFESPKEKRLEAAPFDSAQGRSGTHLERQETELWRVSLWFLVLLGVGLGALAWGQVASGEWPVPGGKGVAAGVVVLAVLFAVYVWQKKRELAELRGFVRGMQARAEAPATLEQVEQLADILRRSQEGYRDLIDSLEDSVFALGLDGTIRAANREFAELLGRPFGELVGRRISEFVDEPRLDGPNEAAAVARFTERRHWNGVVRVQFKERRDPRYLECLLHAIVKGGEVVGAAGLARDVTQQRQSEARFTELFETLQEGVYFTTPDGKLLDANPALVKMLGYASKEELLATNVRELYADPREREAVIVELEEKARVSSREIVLKRKDGRRVRCLDTPTAIRGASGRVERYQGTLVDVTEKREMEEQLHREQEFARRLVESFPDLIVVLDREGKYTYVSPRSEETLGYQPEELVGQKLGGRSDAEDARPMQQLFNDLVTGQRGLGNLEYRTRHKDGSWRVLRATASPLWDESGKVTGVIASARDVTEVKRLEEQVIQSEKLAAMGQMIAGVTHELNNPLTAILGITDLLREKAEEAGLEAGGTTHSGGSPVSAPTNVGAPESRERTGSSTVRQLELVHQQARRASEIVQNLLAYARPKTGKKGKVELGDLVRRALALHEYALRVNNIRVEFQPAHSTGSGSTTHSAGSGPSATGYIVEGDANQLMQVFLNLLMNAEQAITERRNQEPGVPSAPLPSTSLPEPAPGTSGTGETSGRIRVRLGEREEHYWVEFEDDGPGIAAETVPRIFDPFFTTKRPGRGTGLGLSICLAIVKGHGGTIEVESPPEASGLKRDTKGGTPPYRPVGGTLFRVVLPRSNHGLAPRAQGVGEENSGSRPGVAGPVPDGSGAGRQLAGKRILVVDDEESIRELVREGLLRHAGDTVCVDCVGSGEEALERLREAAAQRCSYDVVLCDVKMPGIGGHRLYEAAKSFCAAGPEFAEWTEGDPESRSVGTGPVFVFMTGDVADPETQEFLRSVRDGTELRSAGADPGRVLLKPFRIADLVAALGSALEARRE